MELIHKLKEILADIELDGKKFYSKGTEVAGLRMRKSIKQLQETAQQLRADSLGKGKKKD
jgi:hypothetical protein